MHVCLAAGLCSGFPQAPAPMSITLQASSAKCLPVAMCIAAVCTPAILQDAAGRIKAAFAQHCCHPLARQAPEPSQMPIEQAVPSALLVRGEHVPVAGSQVLVPVWHSLGVGHVTRDGVEQRSAERNKFV